MQDKRETGLKAMEALLGPEMADLVRHGKDTGFASEMGELSLENVFANIWARPGLSPRERSLVTLGILIALRASDQLRIHMEIALRNGLTREEVAEVVYQASGYAGFPAAANAVAVGREVYDKGA